jgi:hypothetical protein
MFFSLFVSTNAAPVGTVICGTCVGDPEGGRCVGGSVTGSSMTGNFGQKSGVAEAVGFGVQDSSGAGILISTTSIVGCGVGSSVGSGVTSGIGSSIGVFASFSITKGAARISSASMMRRMMLFFMSVHFSFEYH